MNSFDPKKIAAEEAVEHVRNGMIVGLGTGTTAYWAIQKLGEKVKQGLKIATVATSEQSAQLATELNIPMISFDHIKEIDLTIDGADEVDANRDLIKGGGGALLREKIIAINSRKYIIVVDATKVVSHLGRFPLPVEIVPYASSLTIKKIEQLGCKTNIRKEEGKQDKHYVTDNGNLIVDCHFDLILDPSTLNLQLHLIAGVVETGLFVNMTPTLIIGHPSGQIETHQ